MAIKTYVLLAHTKPTANVYVQINQTQRQQINARRNERPFLQIAYTDSEGIGRVIRLKMQAKSLFLDDQIEAKILANEKFTAAEYEALNFKHGMLTVASPLVQKFLEVHPQNEKFWELVTNPDGTKSLKGGFCDEVKQPLFKEYDPQVEIVNNSKSFRKNLAAANFIAGLDLEQSQKLLIRLNGVHFTPPATLEACEQLLVSWMDNTDEAGLDNLMRKDLSVDEQIRQTVSEAITKGILSLEKEPGKVLKIKGKNVIPLKEIPEGLSPFDAQVYFTDFLNTAEGQVIYLDLKKEVKEAGEDKKK
jgi:hypothetical protein